MESQAVRRRINTIAGHFAAADDISRAAANIFPLNCSGSLNSVIRRSDNRMYFARQGSCSQGCFMRQASTEQNCSGSLNSEIRRFDNRMYFARQGSCSQGCFMRQASTEQFTCAQATMPLICGGSASKGSSNFVEAPCFSKPAETEPNFLNVGVIQSMVQECNLSSPEPPNFARPNRRISRQQKTCSPKKIQAFESGEFEWSPRMDVAESGCNYILTIELPGACVRDIRVEVNDQTLTVTGKNSTQLWRVASSNDTVSAYHKREISQGSYQTAWPLPTNVNKDRVSAEFLDGLLRIAIPKL